MTAAAALLHRSPLDAPQLISRAPDHGKNHATGTIGFTVTQSNITSQGIACFTRWSRLHDSKVSHALVVTGEKECIEAPMDGGVKRTKLDGSCWKTTRSSSPGTSPSGRPERPRAQSRPSASKRAYAPSGSAMSPSWRPRCTT